MNITQHVPRGDGLGRALQMVAEVLAHPEVAATLIEIAQETPYFDLKHEDGSLYMGRDWLIPYSKLGDKTAARIHHLATPDLDRHLHDHPWDFVSVVLSGGYVEVNPKEPTGVEARFFDDVEDVYEVHRKAGDVAFRRAADRHRIISVEPDTYTLFITGPKVQEWGFYTPEGKIHWEKYLSAHNAPVAA